MPDDGANESLHDNVLQDCKGEEAHLVLGVQVGDVHQVHFRIGGQIIIRAVCTIHPMLLCKLLCLLLQAMSHWSLG